MALTVIPGGRVGPPSESLEVRRSAYRVRLVTEIRTKAWDLAEERRRYYVGRLHVWDEAAQRGSFHDLIAAVMDVRREHHRATEALMQPGGDAA